MTIYDAEKRTVSTIRKQTRVIYVGTGMMAPQKALEYVQKLKEQSNLDDTFYENIFIATKSQETRIEVFP